MTLQQMSYVYEESALRLHERLTELRRQQRQSRDPEQRRQLQRRIDQLRPLWQEARDLAHLTRHYYDKEVRNHHAYTL